MAQIRTKKQKVAHAERVMKQQLYALPKNFLSSSTQISAKTSGESTDFFGYSVELIKKDLVKTLVIASVIVAILGITVVVMPR